MMCCVMCPYEGEGSVHTNSVQVVGVHPGEVTQPKVRYRL